MARKKKRKVIRISEKLLADAKSRTLVEAVSDEVRDRMRGIVLGNGTMVCVLVAKNTLDDDEVIMQTMSNVDERQERFMLECLLDDLEQGNRLPWKSIGNDVDTDGSDEDACAIRTFRIDPRRKAVRAALEGALAHGDVDLFDLRELAADLDSLRKADLKEAHTEKCIDAIAFRSSLDDVEAALEGYKRARTRVYGTTAYTAEEEAYLAAILGDMPVEWLRWLAAQLGLASPEKLAAMCEEDMPLTDLFKRVPLGVIEFCIANYSSKQIT